jgi:hypothetical protein
MPLGTRHTETGVLLIEGPDIVLDRDGGGRWRLDAPRSAMKLVGQRVRITGIRDGFDLLAVETIERF